MLLLALMSALVLPAQRPERRIPYRELLASLWPILSRQPVVQRHAIIGALGFGGFSAFWTTLAFYLANRPEHFNSQITGLFGLVGVVGAMMMTRKRFSMNLRDSGSKNPRMVPNTRRTKATTTARGCS
jgi:predicted MFS family arabinose efflux permease